MAKSNLIQANKKIEEKVVNGYKTIEGAVMGAYEKIEDKFVSQYLTRDDETIGEAKQRLQKEQLERKEAQSDRKEQHENKNYNIRLK